MGEQRNRNRLLTIKPSSLPTCTTTQLRAAISQSASSDNDYTLVTLTPRQADLVALLDTASQHAGYMDTVAIGAGSSYDPDRVQVFLNVYNYFVWFRGLL